MEQWKIHFGPGLAPAGWDCKKDIGLVQKALPQDLSKIVCFEDPQAFSVPKEVLGQMKDWAKKAGSPVERWTVASVTKLADAWNQEAFNEVEDVAEHLKAFGIG